MNTKQKIFDNFDDYYYDKAEVLSSDFCDYVKVEEYDKIIACNRNLEVIIHLMKQVFDASMTLNNNETRFSNREMSVDDYEFVRDELLSFLSYECYQVNLKICDEEAHKLEAL